MYEYVAYQVRRGCGTVTKKPSPHLVATMEGHTKANPVLLFDVHRLWLSSPFTDHPGKLAVNFAILHDLEQQVQHPTRISDRLGDTTNKHS
ncbi:hypothetical protein E2C01_007648 [Portunus trituberculatus]|uniref:Uncharacterized protein n=1 Tax=Portunus trituberculatus TaxID=210409 RepID=A0A5B7D101_PORTR|nr:hypothetical protein [Portunus trituberculatus]